MTAYEMDQQLVAEITKIRRIRPMRGMGKSNIVRKTIKECAEKCEKLKTELSHIRKEESLEKSSTGEKV